MVSIPKTVPSPSRGVLADVRRLLRTQRFAVLATSSGAGPHASLIAFAAVDDGEGLVFITPRDSAKYRNLRRNPNVSLVIDERPGSGGRIEGACGVTVTGTVRSVSGAEAGTESALFLRRHRNFRRYLKDEDVILLRIDVNRYLHTRSLSSVTAVDPVFLKRNANPLPAKPRS